MLRKDYRQKQKYVNPLETDDVFITKIQVINYEFYNHDTFTNVNKEETFLQDFLVLKKLLPNIEEMIPL